MNKNLISFVIFSIINSCIGFLLFKEYKTMQDLNNRNKKVIENDALTSVKSKFQLYYFPIQGRGEFVRLVLAYADADWENKKVEDWGKEKFSTEGLLFKQVPMLIETTESGEENRIVQTGAIIRYISKIFKLGKNDDVKDALLDSYFEGLYEIVNKMYSHLFGGNPEEKDKIPEKILADKSINILISSIEEILEKNGSNGFFMGRETTFVDIVAFGVVDSFNKKPGLEDKLFNKEKTPNLLKVYERVSNIPKIEAYIKSEKRLA